MKDDEVLERLVTVDRADADYVYGLSTQYNVTVNEVAGRGLEPITTITLLIVGSAAAITAVTRLIDKHKGGQVIDLRPQAPRVIYRTKDLIYGLVVVFASDGKVSVSAKDPSEGFGQVMDSLKEVVGQLADPNATELATVAAEKVGNLATVTVEND